MVLKVLLPLFAAMAAASPIANPENPDCPENGLTVPATWDGQCFYPVPDPEVQLDKYLGKWYQQASTTTFFNQQCRCVTATYSLNDDGSVKVFNTCKTPAADIDIEGKATPADKAYGNDGVFRVEFPQTPPEPCPGPNYIVQEYTGDWAIVQASNFTTLFILSREQHVPGEDVDAWLKKAESLGSNLADVTKTDQTDCPA